LATDVYGFKLTQTADDAEILAVSRTGTLRTLAYSLSKASDVTESDWRPFGTLHDLTKSLAAKSPTVRTEEDATELYKLIDSARPTNKAIREMTLQHPLTEYRS
jgi:hypothetical protein